VPIPGNFLSPTTETIDPNTSGWAAKLNCTLSLGSGGRNGDGCVSMKSTAAGEMQARTFSSYTVTPGVVYWTFADAAGSSVPERIGIRWLNAAGAEIGITWSLTTSSASSSWHRISVGGAAPVGASRAQVLVSSTATASGQITFFENVYLGYPLRFAGNLLSFDAEQQEVSGTSWAAESNCTLSRTAPPVGWQAVWYYAGGETLTLTVTASGNASALCVERPPVTPGVEYVAYAYLNPPTTSASCWLELRFYNASGTQISATRATLAAPGTSWYRQLCSAVAPAGAASASMAVGISSGTAGQKVGTEGAVIKVRTSTATSSDPTSNVVLFADSSFEQGVGQWTVLSGVASIARSTPWGGLFFTDSYSLTITSSTATASTIRSGVYPVTAGVNWRSVCTVRRTSGSWSLVIGMRWFDADGILITTTTSQSVTIPSDGVWYTLTEDSVTPAGAATAQLDYILTASATSSVLQLDQVALAQVLPQMSLSVDDASASASLIMREMDTTRLMTVYRILSDGSRTLVRGPSGLLDMVTPSGDTMVIVDYEAPLGVPFSYRAEFYSATTGQLKEWRTTLTVTLDPGDPNYAWLKDPSRPLLNRRVLVKQAPDWKEPIDQQVYRVRGRPNAVVLSGVRSGREGDLVVWTQSDDEREAVRFLLAAGDTLLWQSAPGMGESDVYVSVGEASFPRVSSYAPEPWREWTLPFTEVDRPTGGMAGSATWTVRDVAVENESVLSLISRYATVLDVALDQRAAG
jgi:hypothetical protein